MISDKVTFPDMDPEFRRKKLLIPEGRIRAVLDTDTFNEVDDQFAVSMAMLAPERFDMRAITAAPFFNSKSENPADGMRKSYDELNRLMKLLHHPVENFIFKGSESYLPNRNTPVDSPAAGRIVELAHEADGAGENLWIMAIGAITNVASALLTDPEIIRMVTVVWLGGHPLYWPDNHEFNLYQDVPAAQVIFDSGVPLVQIPCMSVAEMLLTGIDELKARCEPVGPLGSFLAGRVFEALAEYGGYSRSIWDISAPGYFLVPDAFRYEFVPTPSVDDTSAWKPKTERYEMVLVQHISRDPIFSRLFDLLKRAPEI
ncbi:MAG: nucleoside hydrolase [Lentisphaerae bacterium]|nr:nucleoside hydrolase [Lentisphaerota bacterium]